MRTIQVIFMLLLVLLIACDEDKTTTPVETGFMVEQPEADKLNAYPILGYMQTSGDLAPEIDGSGTDVIWQLAPAYEIATEGGKDGFAPRVTMKALYDNWFIYFLITWEDATKSTQKLTWWFGEPDFQKLTTVNVFDTTFIYYRAADTVSTNRRIKDTVQKNWTMVSDFSHGIIETITYKVNVHIDSTKSPATVTYETLPATSKLDTTTLSGDEDKFSIMFNHSSSNFINCANLCHASSSMATDINENVDVWFWYAQRSNFIGYVDDKYLTNDGFHGDVGDSCYILNLSSSLPKYMDAAHNQNTTGLNPDYLYDSLWVKIVPFAPNIGWEAGNTIPGYILSKPTQSRDDIRVKGNYGDNIWAVEIRRALMTAAEPTNFDVDFNPDSNANVDFHIAVFDNTQGKNHAISSSVHVLHFLQLIK